MELAIDREFHALMFPLSNEAFNELRADIQQNGCRDALVIWKGHNIILDGHNRWRICSSLHIPFQTVELAFDDRRAARIWIRKNQLMRRNLNEAQRLELVLANKGELEAIGRERMAEGGKRKGLSEMDKPSEPPHDTRKQLAEEAGVPPTQLARADYVRKHEPELWQKTLREEITIHKAYTDASRSNRRKKRITQMKAKESRLPDQRFAVVLADPPWHYEHSKTHSRDIENQYPTLDLEAIQNLPVPSICADDAVLFLWATSPKLEEALSVLNAWGFTYRTCAVWDKGKIGMGYYFRQQHELLLVGAKGNLPVPEPGARTTSVLRAKLCQCQYNERTRLGL